MLHSRQNLILYTEVPPNLLQCDRSYRQIVGMSMNGDAQWLPESQGYSSAETFPIGDEFAVSIFRYFIDYYAGNGRHALERNCHIGAAAMTENGNLGAEVALEFAQSSMLGATPAARKLPLGRIGIIGLRHNDEFRTPDAIHSIVGLGRGICIQTEFPEGPLSLASVRRTVRQYQTHYNNPHISLYA